MPISIDEFESRDERDEPTNAERVLRFLVQNRDRAFKAAEIADAADIDENSIHPVLKRLEERELIRHKPPYWALGDLEAIRDASMFGSTAAFLDAELGSESRDEWLEAARGEDEDGVEDDDEEAEDDEDGE
jgi:predicted ArsR family transcriptional regulator